MNRKVDKQLHVLLVDAEASDRQSVAHQLAQTFSQLQITEVCQAKELDRALIHDSFDLIITEYQLPWTDGLTILRTSKARWPNCPVIMFTANGNEEIAVEVMKQGLTDYIRKSFAYLPRLSSAAQTLLEQARYQQSPKSIDADIGNTKIVSDNTTKHNRIQERAGISEATLRAIFNSSPHAITLIGPDGQVQAFNEIASEYTKKVFGQTMQVGFPIYNYFRTEDLTRFTKNFQLALNGQAVKVETSLHDTEGDINWFEFIFNPVIDEGQVKGVYVSVMSINERKRMEEALAQSEMRYRAIVEDQTELICRFLDVRTITFANEAYCRYFEKTREELSAEGFITHVFEADKALVRDQLNVLSQDNPVGTLEYRVVRPNQEIRWMQWHNRAIFDEQGQILEFQSVGRDITEYKYAKESLEQRNRELTLLNRTSQAFISTLDLDEVLTSVLEGVRRSLNVVACSVWLIDPETNELVCRQVTDPQSEIVRGWRLPPGKGLGGWVVQHGQSWIVPDVLENERHFKGVDEQTGLPIRSILTIPLWTKKGVIGVLQMVDQTVDRFDATDQRLGEALAVFAASAIENAQLYEQAQQDAETKALLLDEINHRVKNNLAAIIGLLYAERRHTGMENQTTYQMIMKNLINRVQGLATVHSLLSESGWSPLRLNELATQIIHSALQALLPNKQVFIDVSPSSVRVSPKQAHSLALIINELTTNTLKYALAERDILHIKVEITAEETASLARIVTFEFRDDGPGYPDGVLRKEEYEVGMYMIQSIVRTDLRGDLILDNDSGAVTTICFRLME